MRIILFVDALLGGLPVAGRKQAALLRSRSSLLEATQKVLARSGPNATIEEVAAEAGVIPNTIYGHYESKDALFQSAIRSAMRDWEGWAIGIASQSKNPIEQLIIPMRLFIRISQTHPLYAKLIAANLAKCIENLTSIGEGLRVHIKALIKSGELKMTHPEIRITNLQGALLNALTQQLLNPKAKISDGDTAIEIALGIINIAESKANKLAHTNLPKLKKVQLI